MNTLKECFDTILRGNKSDSRLAARKVRKLLYGSQNNRDEYEDIKNLINSAVSEYAKISEEWRQENFVNDIGIARVGVFRRAPNSGVFCFQTIRA